LYRKKSSKIPKINGTIAALGGIIQSTQRFALME
jgi:hypothetical protein